MINPEHNDLDRLLKDNLSDKTAPVPGVVWERIAKKIHAKKGGNRLLGTLIGLGLGVAFSLGTLFSNSKVIIHKHYYQCTEHYANQQENNLPTTTASNTADSATTFSSSVTATKRNNYSSGNATQQPVVTAATNGKTAANEKHIAYTTNAASYVNTSTSSARTETFNTTSNRSTKNEVQQTYIPAGLTSTAGSTTATGEKTLAVTSSPQLIKQTGKEPAGIQQTESISTNTGAQGSVSQDKNNHSNPTSVTTTAEHSTTPDEKTKVATNSLASGEQTTKEPPITNQSESSSTNTAQSSTSPNKNDHPKTNSEITTIAAHHEVSGEKNPISKDSLTLTKQANREPNSIHAPETTFTFPVVTNPYTPLSEIVTDSVPSSTSSRSGKLSLTVYGGPSLYEIAVMKPYFTSGVLSKRTFRSSGFETGAIVNYRLTPRWEINSGIAFNQKSTSFSYNVLVNAEDYAAAAAEGKLIPVEKVPDNFYSSSGYLFVNVKAQYKTSSLCLSLGTTCKLVLLKKFSIGLDLRFATTIGSVIQLTELTTVTKEHPIEYFNSIRIGGGLALDYQLNKRLSFGLLPGYSLQTYGHNSFYAGISKEFIIPAYVRFHF